MNSRWGETNIKGILTEGTAEVQRKITLLSLYDFLYMCFVLILYLFERFVHDHKSVLRTDWPFLEIYYQQTYTKYKIRTEVKIEKRVEREKKGEGGVVEKSSADLMLL